MPQRTALAGPRFGLAHRKTLARPAQFGRSWEAEAWANRNRATRSLESNTALGKYRLVASLGHGGMADVYLAVSKGRAGFNKLVVLKRLRPNLAEDPEFLNMFLDEARLAARLNHPNVVQTNEVDQIGDDYFIAMEYLDGMPLNRIVQAARTKPVPPGFFPLIIADALAGLHYAHQLADYDGTPIKIVHRDCSPHNLFVTFQGQTKVVDFGIAKTAQRTTAETHVGMIKGKFAYMAPEQALGNPIDPRTDIFIVGLVLWETTAGQRIWKGKTDTQIVDALANGDIPKLSEVRPDAPEALVKICNRALATKPDDRYATASEMRRDLVAYSHSPGVGIDQERIAQYLSETFAARRIEITKVVDAQLKRVESLAEVSAIAASEEDLIAAPQAPSLPLLGATPSATPSGRGDGPFGRGEENSDSAVSRPPSLTPNVTTPTQQTIDPMSLVQPPIAPTAQRPPVLLISIGLFLALAGMYFVRMQTATPTPEPTPAPASAQGEGSRPKIELSIKADPPSAHLFLDDAALPSNPYTGQFGADGLGHRLRVEATGFVTQSQIVPFEKSATLTVKLSPPPTPASATATAKPAPPVVNSPPRTPTTNAAPSAAPAPKDSSDPFN